MTTVKLHIPKKIQCNIFEWRLTRLQCKLGTQTTIVENWITLINKVGAIIHRCIDVIGINWSTVYTAIHWCDTGLIPLKSMLNVLMPWKLNVPTFTKKLVILGLLYSYSRTFFRVESFCGKMSSNYYDSYDGSKLFLFLSIKIGLPIDLVSLKLYYIGHNIYFAWIY